MAEFKNSIRHTGGIITIRKRVHRQGTAKLACTPRPSSNCSPSIAARPP
jgi:hypothetical protein